MNESNQESAALNLERELKRYVRQIRPGLIGATANPNVNLALLLDELKTSPVQVKELAVALEEFLSTRDFTTALTETGLTLESGVFSEIYKRLEYKLLPKALDDRDILGFITRLFDAHSDAAWLEIIDRERFRDLLALLLPNRDGLVEKISNQVFLSLEILSLRLAGLGYDPLVTHRLRARPDLQHAFMDVTRHIHGLLGDKGASAIPEIREALDRCTQAVRYIRSRRGVEGASLDLTYRLTRIHQVVQRMHRVLHLIDSMLGEWKPQVVSDLFFEIISAELRRFELGRFVGQNIQLLAYQITEHTGKAGEHYITRSRSEWMAMFRSAAIGGAIIAVLAILKILIGKLGLPPLPESFSFGALYAAGFVLIHQIGGTLATKQPAMTASTLASSLDEAKNSGQAMENLSEIIIRTIRSQIGAVLGNYFVAFPVATLICLPLFLLNMPLLDAAKATATIDSLNGIKGLAFMYAGVAGVCLFVSGLLAGFSDNWFVFNKVGLRLKQSALLRRLVGPHNLDKAIQTIDHNLGFWVGNISLGFFLGAMPTIGALTGLPLDVRHITFSSATFGAAVTSLGFKLTLGLALWVAVCVFIMGLINLGVSFSLSLFLAVRSRRITFGQTPQLIRLLAKKFVQRPTEFIFPLKDPP